MNNQTFETIRTPKYFPEFKSLLRVMIVVIALQAAIFSMPLFAEGGSKGTRFACPEATPAAREVIDAFLLPQSRGQQPAWRNRALLGRANPVIDGLSEVSSRNSIEALLDPSDTDICTRLNRRYSELLSETRFVESRKIEYYVWDVTYFKSNSYYFAVITAAPIPQPDDPKLQTVRVGHDRIAVFDQGLDEIHTYIW